MFSRIRTALGLVLLLTLVVSSPVFAKGNFAFITITGPGLKEPIRSTEPALTTDFFAFADLSESVLNAPANLGVGYEITRYYIDGGQESAFDHLHYYPDSGYVYFDGLVNGSSGYDGRWYIAKTGIKNAFMNALATATTIKSQPVQEAEKMQPNSSNIPDQSHLPTLQPLFTPLSIIVVGLLIGLAVMFRRRRASVS